jgi:hypothetical protein
MTDECDPQAGVQQGAADLAARLALAAAGADGAHGDDGLRRAEHGRVGSEQPEIGSGRERERRLVHHRLVLEVGIGEDHLVDAVGANELGQLLLRADRDALGIERPGERGREDAVRDAGNLRRREGDHLRLGVVAEDDVVVVEVASAGSHDDDLAHGWTSFSRSRPQDREPRVPRLPRKRGGVGGELPISERRHAVPAPTWAPARPRDLQGGRPLQQPIELVDPRCLGV